MQRAVTYKEMLEQGQAIVLTTKGSSMSPLLREGKTTVVVEPIQRELHKGDLPLYIRNNGEYVIHRIIKVSEQNCWTQGDNGLLREAISKRRVLGMVTEIYRNGKLISVTDTKYKAYVWLRMRFIPFRLATQKLWKWTKKLIYKLT